MARRTDRSPLSPAEIVDAALALTRERGLEEWSLRDLAKAVDAWPNAIAHHLGNREAVVHAILDRVVGEIPLPASELAWQDWFRQFLHEGRSILRRYPGAAWRLCRDGPSVPSALAIIDRATGLLLAAGFSERDAPRAYSLLLNNAVLLVALEDARFLTGSSRADVSRSMIDAGAAAQTGPGWAAMRGLLGEFIDAPETTADTYFAFTVDATIAGLERRRSGRGPA